MVKIDDRAMLSIYFLRHAETDYNAHAQFIGGRSNHIPLSTKGEKQALAAGKALRSFNIQFNKVYCSIANRTRQTLD